MPRKLLIAVESNSMRILWSVYSQSIYIVNSKLLVLD